MPAKDEADDALTQMVWGPAYAFYRAGFPSRRHGAIEEGKVHGRIRISNSKDSKMLVRRCAKPDKNGEKVTTIISHPHKHKSQLTLMAEFTKIALATGAGFLVMGFIGFFVKLMY
eukprot:753759-Hanusia_phi.AAC.2